MVLDAYNLNTGSTEQGLGRQLVKGCGAGTPHVLYGARVPQDQEPLGQFHVDDEVRQSQCLLLELFKEKESFLPSDAHFHEKSTNYNL